MAMMERKHKLMCGASECLREKILQDIRVLGERISAEEVELLEKEQAMKELLKERMKNRVEEWRDTDVAKSGGYSEGWVSKLQSGGWSLCLA